MTRPGRAWYAFVVAVVAALLSIPAAAQEPGLGLDVVDRSPWVEVGGTLTVDVEVSPDVESVSVQVHGQLDSADELEASSEADEGPVIFTGVFAVADATPVSDDTVRFVFDISDTINEGTTIRLAYAGVYPLVITPLDADGNEGTPTRTPLIRRSGAGTTLPAPALSLIVDVSTRPTATAEGSRRPFDVDELERFGRLGRFLTRAVDRDVPVTVLVNTDTLDALAASDDATATGLHRALTGPGLVVVPQPTVPLDWPVLMAADLDHTIDDLIERGRAAVAEVDGRVDETTWDGRGGVDAASLDAIDAAGFSRVLVTPQDSDDTDGLVARDVLVADAPEDLDVVAVDATTSRRLTRPGADVDGPTVLADLILRTSEATTTAVVVDDVAEGSGLDVALDLMSEDASPVAFEALDSDTDEPSLVEPVGPDLAAMAEMTDLAPQISGVLDSLRLFESVTEDAATGDVVDAASAMAAGTVQRGLDRTERTLLIAGVAELTSWVADDLRFVGPGDLNLTSRTGTLPIGVLNDGNATVTLVLAARSDRLTFPEGDEIVVDIVPGESRLDLPVEALASGSVPLFVELRAPDGSVVVPTRQYNVRSTAVSGMGLVLSIGALVVLVVWWFRTWRSNRSERV